MVPGAPIIHENKGSEISRKFYLTSQEGLSSSNKDLQRYIIQGGKLHANGKKNVKDHTILGSHPNYFFRYIRQD